MALGQRGKTEAQPAWVETFRLTEQAGHPFYEQLNRLFDQHDFDSWAETRCAPYYHERLGRPSIPPGVYFRMLLIGYFEGIASERGIAWRCADSLSLRSFLGMAWDKDTPDYSSLCRTRQRLSLETHQEVFTWALRVLAESDLLDGKTLGLDATTLEANAALRSIVRRGTGETYRAFLERLAQESGIETPTLSDLQKLDRKRPHKGSNQDWEHPHDPDARITKMKDGSTHLAHKAEIATDLAAGAVVAITVQGANVGDTTTQAETLAQASENLRTVVDATGAEHPWQEVVADKGYHSNAVLTELAELDVRSYIAEPARGRRCWAGKEEAQAAVYGNRQRIRGERGKRLLRLRSEKVERAFAHLFETGGMRRLHLRGRENIQKRLYLHTVGFNLGILMRAVFGVGTPRSLQGRKWRRILELLRRLVLWRTVEQVVQRVCMVVSGFGQLTRWVVAGACQAMVVAA